MDNERIETSPGKTQRTFGRVAVGIALIAVMIATLAIFQPWALRPAGPTEPASRQADGRDADEAVPMGIEAPSTAGSLTSPASVNRASSTPLARSAARTNDAIPYQPFAPHQYDMQRMQIFGEFWRSAEEEWTADRYAAAVNNKDSLDAEQTYQVYVYLRTCLDSPRNETQAMDRFDRVEEAMLRNPRLAEDQRVERWMERVEQGLVRCLGLGDELELLTLDWLVSAAMRGYPLAQIAFYRSYRWVVMRDPTLLTRDPSLVTYYHSLAPRLLATALQSGHPEAFAEMAQAYADGIIYQRDPVTAYAYVLAARSAGIESLDVAAQVESSVLDDLTAGDIREARSMAQDLCAQFCL